LNLKFATFMKSLLVWILY